MTTLATDDFNRADSGNLGANWTSNRGDPTITTNTVGVSTVSDENDAYYSNVSAPADHWSQVTAVATPNGSTNQGSAAVRMPAAGNRDGYFAGWDGARQSSTDRRLWKVVAGTFTSLGNEGGVPVAANDVLYAEAQGSTIKMFVNGSQRLSVTDSSLSGGAFGISATNNASGIGILDSWSGGDFSGAAFQPEDVLHRPALMALLAH